MSSNAAGRTVESWRSWLARLARWTLVGLAAFALVDTLRRADLARAGALVAERGPVLALAIVPWGVALLLQAVGLDRLLAIVGRRAPLPRVWSVLTSAEALLLAFPGGAALAEGANPYLLHRRCGVPVPEGLAATVAKKWLIVVTNGLTMILGAWLGATWLREASVRLVGRAGIHLVVALVGAGLLAGALLVPPLVSRASVAARVYAALTWIPSARARRWLEPKREAFDETDRQLRALFRTPDSASLRSGNLLAAAAAFLASWLVEAADAWVILRLLGVPLPYAQVLGFEVSLAFVRSAAFFVPAGLGIQDAGYVAFFQAFGLPDASSLGVAFILVKRAKEVAWIAIGFSLFMLFGDAPTTNRVRPAVGE